MTMLARASAPWVVQPGWGIYVDLTPPELLNSRQVRRLRHLVVSALVAILLLCVAGYVLAVRGRSAAEDTLANRQLAASQLQSQVGKYRTVTEIDGTVTQIRSEIATLMKGDVALDAFLVRVSRGRPAGLTVTAVSINVSQAGVNGGQTGSGTSIDDSGHVRIGDVKITGNARALDDVSNYVEHLHAIAGVVDVVPTSNTKTEQGVAFDLTLGIDDRLLSHRFDLGKAGNR